MRPGDDARIRPRLALAQVDALAFGAERIADEHRLREYELVVAEVRDKRSERRVVDADPDHQPEGEDRIDQRLAELRSGRGLMVDVQRLRIVGEGGDQQVVGLGDRPRDRMLYAVADLPLVEKAPWHADALGSGNSLAKLQRAVPRQPGL